MVAMDLPSANYGSHAVVPPSVVEVNLAGARFKPGNDWWLLSCEGSACRLDEAAMAVKPSTHPAYDAAPVASQMLTWSPTPPGKGAVIAAFKAKPKGALAGLALRSGRLTTWFHHRMPALPFVGQAQIELDGGRHAVLRQELTDRGEGPILTFALEAGGRVQSLGQYEFHMDEPGYLAPNMYVLWAGDMDGDGQLDLLINTTGFYWNTTLYLSSLAKPGELVGPAGHFQYAPPDASGC